ncbi:hypothetical protein [Alteromonas gilva]|uniref:Uncharacterized protein n=1 Tax=Alteromonas gilva TaxID=2987522 RepID=A0ABT5L7B8_9ALTE|nr:hypothetical protein [Alteromonas gilva]MDC8832934.1 hypothetical protein [Alteromonas gilva]
MSASEVKSPDAESYFHAVLTCDENERYELEVMPYRPAPYPETDISSLVYLKNKAENKVWAISQCGKYSFYSNENTGHILVCSALTGNKSVHQRIIDKKSKGYEDEGFRDYDARSKSLR